MNIGSPRKGDPNSMGRSANVPEALLCRSKEPLAGVSVLGAVIAAILVSVLISVLALSLLAVLILVLILIVHFYILRLNNTALAATLAYPLFQDLSLALKIRLQRSPARIAAVIPPAEALRPPVKIPRKPSLSTASFTPLARL